LTNFAATDRKCKFTQRVTKASSLHYRQVWHFKVVF